MSAVVDLIKQFDESRCHPLIVESKDWDQITPALVEMGKLIDCGIAPAVTVRVLFEVVYTMGYERGKQETSYRMPRFVVAEEKS